MCLVLVVLGCPKVSRVRLACCTLLLYHLPLSILMHSLASIPLLLILKDKGGPTHGHKPKISLCSMEAGISCFTILGKDASG